VHVHRYSSTHVVTGNKVVGNTGEAIDLKPGSTRCALSFNVIGHSGSVLFERPVYQQTVECRQGVVRQTDHYEGGIRNTVDGRQGRSVFISDTVGCDFCVGNGRSFAADGSEQGDGDDGELHVENRLSGKWSVVVEVVEVMEECKMGL
jgi:hypothetical protein